MLYKKIKTYNLFFIITTIILAAVLYFVPTVLADEDDISSNYIPAGIENYKETNMEQIDYSSLDIQSYFADQINEQKDQYVSVSESILDPTNEQILAYADLPATVEQQNTTMTLTEDTSIENLEIDEANLVLNPSLENSDTSGQPEHWLAGSWGNNNAVFTYPVEGVSNGKAAKVEITDYVDGDAKWYFEDIAVTPGEKYVFSNQYKSDIDSEIDIRYTYADGQFGYFWLDSLLSSTDWQSYKRNITIPENVISMTIFHLVYKVGSLTVDDYSVKIDNTDPSEDPDKFSAGLVTLSFDDGWYSQYENALPILDNANIKASFYIVTSVLSGEDENNFIYNPSFDIVTSGGNPEGWEKNNWGENTAIFSYPVTGPGNDNKAAKVEITDYTDGDAKWYFDSVQVVGGELYIFSDQYKSNVESEIDIRYTKSNGEYEYVWIENLPIAQEWTSYQTTITIPADVTAISVFHLIYNVGEITVDNFSISGGPKPNESRYFMNSNDLLVMQSMGHEIGSHTQTHPYLTDLSENEAREEITGAKNDLLSLGLYPVDTFAYPYGKYNSSVKQFVEEASYVGARSVDEGYNTKSTDKYLLKTQNIETITSLEQIKSWIDTAVAGKIWLIIVFHEVGEGNDEYSTTPEILQGVVDYLAEINVSTITINEGLNLMNN